MGFLPKGEIWKRNDGIHRKTMAFARLIKRVFDEALARVGAVPTTAETPSVCAAVGWTSDMFQEAAEMAAACRDVSVEELAYAAFRAIKQRSLPETNLLHHMSTFGHGSWVLYYSGITVMNLLAWRENMSAVEVPPAELVAYRLSRHWGKIINKRSYRRIGLHLALAFPEGQLPHAEGEQVIGKYGLVKLTPSLTVEFAEDAIESIRRRTGP